MTHAGTALVTGGAGFIGSHVTTALVAAGWHVRVLDSLVGGSWGNLDHLPTDAVTRIQADVRDEAAVSRALEGVSAVFHKAAVVSVFDSVADPLRCHDVNGSGTARLFELARLAGVQRIVFAASAAAYGQRPGLPKREHDEPNPLSPYASTKLYGEQLCSVYTATFGMACFPLRYFNIFGPRQDPRGPYAAVISKFVDGMTQGRAPVIFGDGTQTRDFCHVSDVVQANLAALAAPASAAGMPINIGTGRQVTLLDLVDALNSILGSDLQPEFRDERLGDIRHSVSDISRARMLLGYEPTVSLVDGLRTLVDEQRLKR